MWKEYIQPIIFVFSDSPLYPRAKTSFATSQYVTTHWLEIQDWLHQQLGYTFALMTPMNVAANPVEVILSSAPLPLSSNQADYNQYSVFREMFLRGIIELANPNILYYVHTWGPKPDMDAVGTYDGHAWGFDTDAGRCMDAPSSLVDICSLPYYEIVGNAVSRWSNDLAKGRDLHELCHGMAALPDLAQDTGANNPMWAWWDWPKIQFNDDQKMKLLESRWLWVR